MVFWKDAARLNFNLSFPFIFFDSLKTAVLRESKKINGNDKLKFNLAASFQNTINKILYKKTKIAIEMLKKRLIRQM